MCVLSRLISDSKQLETVGTTEEESAPSEEDNYTQDLSIVGRIQIQAIHCGISYLNFSYEYDAVLD